MVAFYDADRDTGLFAARLCRSLGVRAYFFPVDATTLESGPRLTDDDFAVVAEHHELCFHTSTHRSAQEITPANQESEVLVPLERLTRAAGRPPRLAAWRGGARFDAGSLGDMLLRDRGVRHLVSNWSVEPLG
jgi:peptidoglycan/xylan/chitin deacetylase (PgdA/CDA1 family)